MRLTHNLRLTHNSFPSLKISQPADLIWISVMIIPTLHPVSPARKLGDRLQQHTVYIFRIGVKIKIGIHTVANPATIYILQPSTQRCQNQNQHPQGGQACYHLCNTFEARGQKSITCSSRVFNSIKRKFY